MRALTARFVPAAAAAAVLALALPAVSPDATTDADRRRLPRSEILQLDLRNGTSAFVDVAALDGDTGEGVDLLGDYEVVEAEVFQRDDLIGRATQQCFIVGADGEPEPDTLVHCTLTLMLPQGQVTIQGSFGVVDFPPTLAVTGGTGRYQGVWGEAEETEGENLSTGVELRLHYPRR